MINERAEVQQYLQGKNLHRDIEYRICLLLAKWFYEQGYKTEPEIRAQLKKWAIENNFYFDVSMKTVASRVIDEDMKLLGNDIVYINKSDIELIDNLFDTYYEKITALGILCYAKLYADDNGEFKLSKAAFNNWIKLNRKTTQKYIDELVKYKYIEKIEPIKTRSWYQTVVTSTVGKFRILVPFENNGEFELVDNNIEDLYSKCFMNCNLDEEIWFDIPGYNDWYQVSNLERVKVKERSFDGRVFSERILKPFKSKSGKLYVNLFGEDGKQKKIMVQKLIEMST